MKNSSKTSWNEISHDNFRDVFKTLEKVFITHEITFFLLGALARDIWSGIHGFSPPAATKDIDVAIYLHSKEDYELVKNDLIENHNFNKSSENQFVLISPNGTQIDLSPFGEIADKDERVHVDGVGFTSISVEGFQDVYEHGLETVIVEDSTFDICSIPAIIVLKLIAWNDRPEQRQKDILDIFHLIDIGFPIFQNQIYGEHSDILLMADEANNYDRAVGAMILGRKIELITQNNPSLHKKLLAIVADEINDIGNSRLVRLIAQRWSISLEVAAEPFKYLHGTLEK